MTKTADAVITNVVPGKAHRVNESVVDDLPVLRIQPRRGALSVDWRELWRYRDLLYFLTWRDVKVRYKQTVLGIGWAILQPIMTMVVFSIFFGRLAGMGHKTGG